MIVPEAAEKRGFLKKLRSSIGCSHRSSHAAKRPRNSTPRPSPARTLVEPQPLSGAWMIPYSSVTRPMIESRAPKGSSLESWGSRLVGTRKCPATSAVRQIGTLTRNTEPHEKCSTSRPPANGPMAIPSPDTPAQMPMARARSEPSKVLVSIDSVVGKIRAPPTPIKPRAAISAPVEPAVEANAEQAANRPSPAVSTPLRPSLSPREPAVSNRQANTIV